MAIYASEEFQHAENQRLYLNGGALAEVLAAGESVPDGETREHIRRLTAIAHAKVCSILLRQEFQKGVPSVPRLIMDLHQRGFLTYQNLFADAERPQEEARIERAWKLNNEEAAAIIVECREGNFARLPVLEVLLTYQVRIDEPAFVGMLPGAKIPIREEIAGFRHTAKVRQCEEFLLLWRRTRQRINWLNLFEQMIMNDISPRELPMTIEEREAFERREIPQREDNPEADPDVNNEAVRKIKRHIQTTRKHPEQISDMETFLLIEHCNEWYKVYREECAKLDDKALLQVQ